MQVYASKQDEYRRCGYTIVEGVVDNPDLISNRILNSENLIPVFKPEPYTLIPGGKGSLKYKAMDRLAVDKIAPEIGQIYHNFVHILKFIIGSDVVISKDIRSAYSAKAYIDDGDEQGWHYDSNEITGVLYLTSTCKSGFTEIDPLDSEEFVSIIPQAGSVLILQGRECWHRAAPVRDGEIKVICPFNYFRSSNSDRDPAMNSTIFGK